MVSDVSKSNREPGPTFNHLPLEHEGHPYIRTAVEEKFHQLNISTATVLEVFESPDSVVRTDDGSKGRPKARWEVRGQGLVLVCGWHREQGRVYIKEVLTEPANFNQSD